MKTARRPGPPDLAPPTSTAMPLPKKAKEQPEAPGLAERKTTKTLVGNYRITKRCPAPPGTATRRSPDNPRPLRDNL
ncbi:hypothetical protein [Streptomyces sp. NPDC093707]|uniref:hypothetical protein n=1 Tax=Streptomyces sp. NPDC093707 TaxID=3154984 RepID=UPI00344FA475